MKFSATIFLLGSIVMSTSLMANEPQTKAEQCALYGSYQDEDGTWQTCAEEDMPSEDS